MSIPHFFIDNPEEVLLSCAKSQDPRGDHAGQQQIPRRRFSVPLPQQTIAHMHTLRLRAGEHIVLVDAPGHGWELELTVAPDKKTRHIDGMLVCEHTSTQSFRLTLVQGISTADRMDQTIRQVTELGVSRIIPLESERSTVRLTDDTRGSKRERWQRIAQGAAEQSGQLRQPQIENPVNLAAALELLGDYDVILFFWEEGGEPLATVFPRLTQHPSSEALTEEMKHENRPPVSFSKVALFIGPEGGFSEQEASLIKAAGAKAVTLGETILRTETAAVVASALVLFQLGALGAS
jgi:16S rRNA (uracil1498-N3)-methyltransferase